MNTNFNKYNHRWEGIVCQPCGKRVKVDQCSQITQHLAGNKHTAAVSLRHVLSDESSSSNELQSKCLDLCKLFVAADISLKKLNNTEVRFPNKYIDIDLPDESTL